MDAYFYLTTNTHKNEPEVLASSEYVHVKAKGDGSQTAIITEYPIEDASLQEMSQEELQAVIDEWIAGENENPELDLEGNPMLQIQINIGAFLNVQHEN